MSKIINFGHSDSVRLGPVHGRASSFRLAALEPRAQPKIPLEFEMDEAARAIYKTIIDEYFRETRKLEPGWKG